MGGEMDESRRGRGGENRGRERGTEGAMNKEDDNVWRGERERRGGMDSSGKRGVTQPNSLKNRRHMAL